MINKIKTGLMAYGMSGKVFHAPFLDTNSGFELVAIVERTKKDAVKDYPNVKTYANNEELLAQDELELIVVNTPNFTHFEYAKAALNANKHILIEKPFSVTVGEAKTLFKLAKQKGKKVLAYQNRRFDSDFLAVKKIVDQGILGNLIEVHIRFDRYRNEISTKSFKEEEVPGTGIFYDLGAHILDQAIALFGSPKSFTKTYGKFRANTKVDDYAQAHLKYANGLQVFTTANMLVAKPQPAFTLIGVNGTLFKHRTDIQEPQLLKGIKPNAEGYGIEDGSQEGELYLVLPNGDVKVTKVAPEKGDYTLLFDAVYETIRNGKEYFVKEEDILTQLSILEN
jgi:scyllo-inositol 2-dehydrogenase (NADP+)